VKHKSFATMACSIAQCLEITGEWWTMLILRDAFLGYTRFEEFQQRLGVARNVLTQRLNRLVDHGILTKVAYQDHPPRYDYRLTDKGRDLWPVLTALREWGDRWAAPNGAPLEVVHEDCGEVTHTVAVCDHCGEPLHVHNVRARRGPGAEPTNPIPVPRRRAASPTGA
jgi:DNA-binding HxlR family transcriptional regulator